MAVTAALSHSLSIMCCAAEIAVSASTRSSPQRSASCWASSRWRLRSGSVRWTSAASRWASDDAHGSGAARATSALAAARSSGTEVAVRVSHAAMTSRSSGEVLVIRRGARASVQTSGSMSSAPASTCGPSRSVVTPRTTASIRASTPSRHDSRGARATGSTLQAAARARPHAATSASICRAATVCLPTPARAAGDQTCAGSNAAGSQRGRAASWSPARIASTSTLAATSAPIPTPSAIPGRRSTRTIWVSSASMLGQRSAGSGSSPRRRIARTRRGIFEASSAAGPSAACERSSSSVGPRYGRSPASASHSATQNAN